MVSPRERKRLAAIMAYVKRGTFKGAARDVGTGPQFVKRWVQHFNATGGVEKKGAGGRPRAMDDEATNRALELLLAKGSGGADSVAQQLYSEGFTSRKLDPTTIARRTKARAKARGKPIRALTGKPRRALTETHKAQRLHFALANKTRNWRNVLFTDRKRFEFKYPGSPIGPVEWVEQGQRREVVTSTNPMSLNLYMGISVFGVTSCHFVAGTSKHKSNYTTKKGKPSKNICASEYKVVLENTLLPEGEKMFRQQGVSRWFLQQDNDRSHKEATNIVKRWNKQGLHCVEVLKDWPPNSPDLNLIENVWGHVQMKVNKKGCSTFEEFTQAVLNEMRALSTGYLQRLYASMNTRLAQVIDKGGDRISY